MQARRRHPLWNLGLLATTVLLGLCSRRFGAALPGFIATYAGDTLWALALFLSMGLLLPRLTTARVAALALAGSILVEISQLYHAPWIDSVRQTTIGGLVLGFGFLCSDLACYAVGVGLGVALEWMNLGSQGRRDERAGA
jgi:Protein of unknown function (DUF2809)